MKIRDGFVSNSSSSSFIVSGKNDDKLSLTMTLNIDISQFVKKTIKTKDELYNDEDIMDMVSCDEVDLSDLLNKLDNGEYIYKGRFSDEEGPEEFLLCHNGINQDNFNGTVLFTQSGY